MKRTRIAWMLGLALAVLVLGAVLASTAVPSAKADSAAPVTFTDPLGDADGGVVDLSSVVVSNTGGVLTFVINTKSVEVAGPVEGAAVRIWLDTDENAATGDYDGTEYSLGYSFDAGGYDAWVGHFTGATFDDVSAPSMTFTHTSDTATFTIAASDLGHTTGFAFYVDTVSMVPGLVWGDVAPNAAPETLWHYTLTTVTPTGTQPVWGGPGALAGLLSDGSMYVGGADMMWHRIDPVTFAALGYDANTIAWYQGSLPGTIGAPIPPVVPAPVVSVPVVPLAESVAVLPKIGAPLPVTVTKGKSVVVTFPIVNGATGEKLTSITMMSSSPTVGGKLIRPHVERFTDGVASVGLKVPATTKAKQLKVKLTIEVAGVTTTRIATIPIA